jgi:hypothetical protein
MARSTRAVRIFLLVAAVIVTVLVIGVWPDRPSLPPGTAAKTNTANAEEPARREQTTSRPSSVPPPAQPEATLPGTSKLARRFAAGDSLWSLREALDRNANDAPRIEGAVTALLPHLLHADGWRSMPPHRTALRRALAALTYLTEPRRDTGTLRLAGAVTEDPYGERMLLRIWSLGEDYPLPDLARARKVLALWLKLAEHKDRNGFDVIVSPKIGRDVFPAQVVPPRAWGVHYLRDGYCTAIATIPHYWRRRVVQHELAHATCAHLSERFTDSRFISEGLAEFLEHTDPRDERLDYGAERFANEMAALDAILTRFEAGGVRFPPDLVQLFLSLPPAYFYALGHFGYLVGLAAIGHAGGERVEEALRQGADRPLREHLEALDWAVLRTFIAEAAGSGDPGKAFVMQEGGPGHDGLEERDWKRTFASPEAAWRRLRIQGPLRVERLAVPRAGSPFDWNLVGEVIRRLFESEPPTAFVTDLSEAMDEGLDLRPWSTEFRPLNYEKVKAESPRKFVETLWLLAGAEGSPVPVLPLADVDPRRTMFSDVRAHTGLEAPRWMWAKKNHTPLERVILCTAGGDFIEGDPAAYWKSLESDKAARRALDLYRKAHPRGPEVALVIDLGAQPTKYALHWTYVLAAASDFQNPVAYWNPRLPRR